MTTIEAVRIINAIKCSMVTTPKEHEALTMAERVLFEQERKSASADALIRHGRWIKAGEDFWDCSECGQRIFSMSKQDREKFHKWCGRCGARMDGKDEGKE